MKIQIYKFEKPSICIQEIIELKSDNKNDVQTHFVPPIGSPEIILYIRKKQQIKNTNCINGFIKGQYITPQKIDFKPSYHFISIRLYPFGLKQLFNLNSSEFNNSVIDLNSYPIFEYLEKLIQNCDKVDIELVKKITFFIEQFPLNYISNSTLSLIKEINKTDKNTIKSIVKELGINIRTAQRNFKNEVGLTLKEYLRIIRINKIEQQLSQSENVFQIVADFNFTDQSHLVKEFKQLRNYTPNEMIKKKLFLSDQLVKPDFVQI